MTVFQDYTLNQSEFVIKFGCNGGMTVVRGACYDKIINLDVNKLPLLFQPVNARMFRQFALETIVSSHISYNKRDCIHDLMNLTELSMTISSMQFKDKFIARNYVKEINKNIKLKSKSSQVFLDILIDMFLNDQIGVSITHPIQFSKFFNLTKDDNLVSIVKMLHKKINLLSAIHVVGLSCKMDDKENYFINTMFPSIVRSINPGAKEGRRIRGQRELIKHKKDIISNKLFTYTAEEEKLLLRFLDDIIARSEKDSNEIIN